MSQVWLQDGAVVLDSEGRVILCAECPCTGTGTVAPPGTYHLCGSYVGVDRICVLVGGDGLGLTGGGTGTDDVGSAWAESTGTGYLPNAFLLKFNLHYDSEWDRWHGHAIFFDGNFLGPDETLTVCRPRIVEINPPVSPATDMRYAYGRLECGLGLELELTVQGVNVGFRFWPTGSLDRPPGGAIWQVDESYNLTTSVAAASNVPNYSFAYAQMFNGDDSCEMLQDTFNVKMLGDTCSEFQQTPRFMLAKAGSVSPTYLGLLLHQTGCTWAANAEPCTTATLTKVLGRLTYTVSGAANYVFRQPEETGTGSSTGTYPGDIWDQINEIDLYFDEDVGTAAFGAGDYITVQPWCGWDFAPCPTLNWPETLFATISSACSLINGMTLSMQRLIVSEPAAENEYYCKWQATGSTFVRLTLRITGGAAAVDGNGMTATARVSLVCSAFTPLGDIGTCTPITGATQEFDFTMSITSCEPFLMETVAPLGLAWTGACTTRMEATCPGSNSTTITLSE